MVGAECWLEVGRADRVRLSVGHRVGASDAFNARVGPLSHLSKRFFFVFLTLWLLVSELVRSLGTTNPFAVEEAEFSERRNYGAKWAAWIGLIRGDLWSEAAYSYAGVVTPRGIAAT